MPDCAPQPHDRDGDDEPALRELKEKQRRELIGIQFRDQNRHPRDAYGKVQVFGIAEKEIISRYPVDAVDGIVGGSMRFITTKDLTAVTETEPEIVIDFGDDGSIVVRGEWSQKQAVRRLVTEAREFAAHVRTVCPVTNTGDFNIELCRRTLIRRHGQLTQIVGMVQTKAPCTWNEPTAEQSANGVRIGTIKSGRGRDVLPDILFDILQAITFSWPANDHDKATLSASVVAHIERLADALDRWVSARPSEQGPGKQPTAGGSAGTSNEEPFEKEPQIQEFKGPIVGFNSNDPRHPTKLAQLAIDLRKIVIATQGELGGSKVPADLVERTAAVDRALSERERADFPILAALSVTRDTSLLPRVLNALETMARQNATRGRVPEDIAFLAAIEAPRTEGKAAVATEPGGPQAKAGEEPPKDEAKAPGKPDARRPAHQRTLALYEFAVAKISGKYGERSETDPTDEEAFEFLKEAKLPEELESDRPKNLGTFRSYLSKARRAKGELKSPPVDRAALLTNPNVAKLRDIGMPRGND